MIQNKKIVIAAANLFQVKGYNGTGLNEILKESNAPKGSLYYYFKGGKEELAGVINNIIDDLKRDNKPKDISLSLIALETHLSNEVLRKACDEAFRELTKVYYEKLIEGGIPESEAENIGEFIQVTMEGAISVAVTQKIPTALLVVKSQLSNLLNVYLNKK
ncbi:MAG: TetR/AcrR family transcriptional regulator [Clostridium sp.]|nr:TetR/AcrR family transcriptional regulator [Clostridium sp.]